MRKNILVSIIIILILSIFTLFPAIATDPSNQVHIVNIKNSHDDIPLLKNIGPVGTYEEYLSSRANQPFFIRKLSNHRSITSPLVIIFIESTLVNHLASELEIYNTTLGMFGYNTIIFEVSGGTAEDIKEQIVSLWEDGYAVCGSVLIGDLPTEWFHHENDFYGSSEFPCDLFLMDLDGTWSDTDGDNMYDLHTDGTGDTAPEVYVGRIDASKIPGDEINILKNYFDKIHDFWSGTTNQTLRGLTYTDHDWAEFPSFRYDISYAYNDYEAIWYPNVHRDDYVLNRIPSTYEFIQLSCHSSSAGHAFHDGGWAYSNDIRNAPPKALFYNLFCCSSLRFTENNCLGYAYILNTNTPSLAVVGSTKTGSMLDFRYFYEPIGNGASFGSALKQWFEYEYPYANDDISWFYGMTILGDPTLIIHCPKNFPPQGSNITGPNEGITRKDYSFSINVFDPEGNTIYCNWRWGDETQTGWMGPYSSDDTIMASHNWTNIGNYDIQVNLRDDMGSESGWSDPKTITILQAPLLHIHNIEGGLFQVGTTIKNEGDTTAHNISWSVTFNGGTILLGRESTGTISKINAGDTVTITSDLIIGFGKTQVTVNVAIPKNQDVRSQRATLFLFYILVNPGGGII